MFVIGAQKLPRYPMNAIRVPIVMLPVNQYIPATITRVVPRFAILSTTGQKRLLTLTAFIHDIL